MCGISGFCGRPEHYENEIRRMNHRMAHRGPDGEGIWVSDDRSVVFGHRRLSIIDLNPTGAQPMTSHSGRYVITFNGEIYNHKYIKNLLTDRGIRDFRGTSDTEILLEAFEHLGIEKTLSEIKGMFAIGLYDKNVRKLYLMRDRIGEKPLYYGYVKNAAGNRSFVFSSELACIRTLDHFDNEINSDVLPFYISHGYIPTPHTIYRDIYKLQPGSLLTLEEPYAQPRITTYWSLIEKALYGQSHPFKGTEEEAAEELESRIKASISDQMQADVPLGAFLSAGIDSSTIVSLMQQLSTIPVRTFTIGMDDADQNEAVIARQIAGILGTDHTELYISEDDAKAVIPKLSGIYSEPFADSSQIPTYLVSHLTRKYVTVALSGDAGDELFCGYNAYGRMAEVWSKMERIPGFLRKALAESALSLPLPLNDMRRIQLHRMSARDIAGLYEAFNTYDPALEGIIPSRGCIPSKYLYQGYEQISDPMQSIMVSDLLLYHPDDILVKVDRSAMAVSLESRIPLLDRDVVEYALTLPVEYKKSGGITKRPLRHILYKHIPRELMERPKKGFSIPIDKWLMTGELREWAQDLMDPVRIKSEGLLDEKKVSRLWTSYTDNGKWNPGIWHILMLEQWLCADRNGV